VIRGTRGNPGTVAPFRAWRGSRDLVAQSPKFHAPAVVHHDCFKNCSTPSRSSSLRRVANYLVGLASGGITSDGFIQFTLKGPMPCACTMLSPLHSAKWCVSFGITVKSPTFMG
jgi:hypothetical protein